MGTIASQITSLTNVYSTVYLGADQIKHQSSASLAFVRGIHRDRWIPRPKGQLRGKCFHLMTSSCSEALLENMTKESTVDTVDESHKCGRPWRLVANKQEVKTYCSRCYMFLNIKRNISKSLLHVLPLWYFDISVICLRKFCVVKFVRYPYVL